jgi:hypothetical protein
MSELAAVAQPCPSPIIMRTFKLWSTVMVCIAAVAAPLSAAAQQAPQSADATPPKLEKLEEGEAPAITIRKQEGERKITEKREQGKVTEVKVQSGKSTYYLKSNEPAGSALPGDTESSSMRAPQWQVLEFGHPKNPKEAEPPQTLAPAPPASEPPNPPGK